MLIDECSRQDSRVARKVKYAVYGLSHNPSLAIAADYKQCVSSVKANDLQNHRHFARVVAAELEGQYISCLGVRDVIVVFDKTKRIWVKKHAKNHTNADNPIVTPPSEALQGVVGRLWPVRRKIIIDIPKATNLQVTARELGQKIANTIPCKITR